MAVVLVADDMLPIVDLLTRFIEGCGHTVVSASNGICALALASDQRPQLVISDIQMPQMNGYDLLRALRADPTFATTRVYLLSADGDINAQPDGPVPDGYIEKPFDLAAIKDVLATVSSV